MSRSSNLEDARAVLADAGEGEGAAAAERFADAFVEVLGSFDAPAGAAELVACIDAVARRLSFEQRQAVGAALGARIERLVAVAGRWAACADQLLVPNPEHPHVSLWTGDVVEWFFKLHLELMMDGAALTRWAAAIPELFSTKLPHAFCGMYTSHVLAHDAAAWARLTTTVLRATAPPSERWSRTRSHHLEWLTAPLRATSKLNLRKFTRAIVAEARGWSDDELDEYVAQVLPPDDENATPRSFVKAPQRLAVLEALVATGRTSPGAVRLADFVESAKIIAAEVKAAKPVDEPAPADAVEIRDFGFKLALIQAVMYELGALAKFDVRTFAKGYLKREIDVEEEGYSVIPEAKRFFQKLPLSAAHLAQIRALAPDGGDDVYMNVAPYWGGEAEWFNIRSLAGIEHCTGLETVRFDAFQAFAPKELARLLACPALREVSIYGLADSRAAKKVVEELRRRGVAVTLEAVT